jgi:hypothetical protein
MFRKTSRFQISPNPKKRKSNFRSLSNLIIAGDGKLFAVILHPGNLFKQSPHSFFDPTVPLMTVRLFGYCQPGSGSLRLNRNRLYLFFLSADGLNCPELIEGLGLSKLRVYEECIEGLGLSKLRDYEECIEGSLPTSSLVLSL